MTSSDTNSSGMMGGLAGRISERKAIMHYLTVRAGRSILNREKMPWWHFRQRALARWIAVANATAAKEIEQGAHVEERSVWLVDIEPGVMFAREATRHDESPDRSIP